ncbi:hypothetical protein [Amycolatopsis sp. NPDC059021]|uniref:hypothetical protein n=1 Tax=Amycolatopsis sp. NPDC059021 TaxID=3346704 RepID=UPI00366BEBAD
MDALGRHFERLRARRWTLYFFGVADSQPRGLAASWCWDSFADVVIVRDATAASAFRAVLLPDTDLLNPQMVCWQFHGDPVTAIDTLLALPEPGSPGAPVRASAAGPRCSVPLGWPRPQILPPEDESAGDRS